MDHLNFHPVWDRTLSDRQKEDYRRSAATALPFANVFDALLLNGSYKKNGGAVATVFLRNGYEGVIRANQLKAVITDAEEEVVAEETFSPDLPIKGRSVQPWSFVFDPENVKKADSDPKGWKVGIQLADESEA